MTYEVCSQADAAAAGDADGGSDDAGVCYPSCFEACMLNVPPGNQGGVGSCVGDIDGGDAAVRVAECQVLHLCGRRLEGLSEPDAPDAIAHAAWLEAASIQAFRRLARELRAHGAPEDLVMRARACARDEARHARLMARLAHRRGARVPRVDVDDMPVRELEAMARENAVEACVGETCGALFAAWQARCARDPEVREVMASIAPDELRHAALGWDVAAWADAKLDAEARSRVRIARARAVAELAADERALPTTRALVSSLREAGIWS